MKVTSARVAAGAPATDWLCARIRHIQRDDPLAPVTVIVPHHYAGLHLRRTLAADGGYAAVRFTILARLAEMLGAGRLGREERMPLSAAVRGALVRSALRSSGGPLAHAADHAGLVELVAELAHELRRRLDPQADRDRIMATRNPTSVAALQSVDAYERLRKERRRYDEVDLLGAATAAVASGEADGLFNDVGHIVVFLPDRIDTAEAHLLKALAGRMSLELALLEGATTQGAEQLVDDDPPPADGSTPSPSVASVTIAGDAVAEVRSAIRDCLAAMEREPHVPLHRQAIVYRDEDAYGQLLRDTLTVAGIPFSSLDGRSLADTTPARALLGLIRLRDEDFARGAVLAWLSALPEHGGVLRNQARWDQLSRSAGVVRGVGQWATRLRRFVKDRRRDLAYEENRDADASAPRRAAIQRDIDDAKTIREHVGAIASLTTPPSAPTWRAHVEWLCRLRDQVLKPDRAWSEADVEASQLIDQIIEGLGAAHDVEPEVTVRTVLRTLEDALRARRLPEGRMGAGILIGPHHRLLGLDLDRVQVLGVLEGAFPSARRIDPLLPGDPLGRRPEHEADERRHWLVAVQVARVVGVSAPLVDVEGRAVYPSPWLLHQLASDGVAPPASAVRDATFSHPRLRRLPAFAVPAEPSTPLSLAERREWEVLRAREAGHDVAGCALAKRPELPLGRALAVTRARSSPELTEFDGGLAAAAGGSHLLTHGLAARTQSPTAVEEWATCPFNFLLARILAVAATEDVTDERWWRIDARERGSLIHRILAEFFIEVARSGEPPPGAQYEQSHHDRLDELAEKQFASAEELGVTGHQLVWRNERAIILRDLHELLIKDAEERGAGGWRPAFLEQPFGLGRENSWPAVRMALPDGREVSFRGVIDRVDVADGRARVLDYKTGRKQSADLGADNLLDRGRKLQLPVYALAHRQQAERGGGAAPDMSAAYWYVTSSQGFATADLVITPEVDATLGQALALIDGGVRAGCFPQVPGDFEDFRSRFANCAYCAFDSLCPSERDVIAAAKASSDGTAGYRLLAGDDGKGEDAEEPD